MRREKNDQQTGRRIIPVGGDNQDELVGGTRDGEMEGVTGKDSSLYS